MIKQKNDQSSKEKLTLFDANVSDMESAVSSVKMLLTEQDSQYTEDLFDGLDDAQVVSQEILRFEFSV